MFGPSFSAFMGGSVFLTDWPNHTAGVQGAIEIDASSFIVGSPAWEAHDGGVEVWQPDPGDAGPWWRVRFESYRRVTAYQATAGGGAAAFTLQGSNDGSTWTDLHGSQGTSGTTHTLTDPRPWIYYRLRRDSGGAGAGTQEVTFTFSAN